MRKLLTVTSTAVALLATVDSAHAGTDIFFNPLTQSSAVAIPNHINEFTAPWVAPAGITQENLTSLAEIEDGAGQSVIRVSDETTGGRPRNASMIDMVAYDPSGRFIFMPHETYAGAGVTRYDVMLDRADVLFAGDTMGATAGDWSNDWGAFDPCTYTPQGTIWLGEEWSGEGRIMEVTNPFAPIEDIVVREVESIANVSHEGLRFSDDGKTVYYVDEWNSGSIYKFVAKVAGDYNVGQTFVLKVNAYAGDATANWNDPINAGATRVGKAKWIPLTNKNGVPKTTVDPFRNGPTNDPRSNDDTRGGRPAADEVGATPYGRPEDIEVGHLANGNEVVYFAATSEKTIYSIEMTGAKKAVVRVTASAATTPKNLGYPATTGTLDSPDNLAQDALGNIYIIEDKPNGDNVGGDVWFIRDTNTDGVAESIDHFLSIQVDEAEATGMIFNPANPYEFAIAVQHPESTNLTNVADGFGDSLWRFNIENVVPPPCAEGQSTKLCNRNRKNFAKALRKAARAKKNK